MLLFSAWDFSQPSTFERRLELQHFFIFSQYFIGDKFRNSQHLIIHFFVGRGRLFSWRLPRLFFCHSTKESWHPRHSLASQGTAALDEIAVLLASQDAKLSE